MKIIMIILIFLYSYPVSANVLNNGVQAGSLGTAYSARLGDVEAVLYNPAGISTIKNKSIGIEHSFLLSGLDSGGIGSSAAYIVLPYSKINGALGINWDNFSVYDVFSINNFRFTLSSSILKNFSIIETINIGINIKYLLIQYLANKINVNSSFFSGRYSLNKGVFSGDAGIIIKSMYNISFGLYIADINSPDLGVESSRKLKPKTKFGMAYSFFSPKSFFLILRGIDILGEYNLTDAKINAGIELKSSPGFTFRIGIAGSNLSGGIGYTYKYNGNIYGLNYCIENVMRSSVGGLYNHRLSIDIQLP